MTMLTINETDTEKLKKGILTVLNARETGISIREAEYSFETEGTRFLLEDGKLTRIIR